VDHVGEWRVAVRAATREEIFAEVARVIAHAITGRRGPAGAAERIEVEASDLPALLVNWANELIGTCEAAGTDCADVRGLVLHRAPPGWRLSGEARFRPVRGWRSPLKAATHHGVRFETDSNGWFADLLFDV
jgi:SHS2 domain-containing protein